MKLRDLSKRFEYCFRSLTRSQAKTQRAAKHQQMNYQQAGNSF